MKIAIVAAHESPDIMRNGSARCSLKSDSESSETCRSEFLVEKKIQVKLSGYCCGQLIIIWLLRPWSDYKHWTASRDVVRFVARLLMHVISDVGSWNIYQKWRLSEPLTALDSMAIPRNFATWDGRALRSPCDEFNLINPLLDI